MVTRVYMQADSKISSVCGREVNGNLATLKLSQVEPQQERQLECQLEQLGQL